MTIYRPATFKDGVYVANNLKDEDRMEVEAFGHTPTSIPFSLLFSEHPTVFTTHNGDIAGVAAIVRQDDNVGAIWMLCTPAVLDMPITFFRQSKRWMSEVEGDYKMLWNLADARNHLHHKLLRFLGFRAIQTVPTGPHQLPFYEIVRLCV
jgi:hypothetical protein